MTDSLALGGTTYSWLHQASFSDSLRGLAEAGFRFIEITTAAPHLQSIAFGAYERHALLRELRSHGLTPVSVNPGFLDINMLSPSDDLREASVQHMISEIELAADLEAPFVVAIPGKRHALSPAPVDACRWWLDRALDRLIARAEPLGVTIALETSPYGFLGSGQELAEVVDAYAHPHLGIAYDCANTLTTEDVASGVAALGDRLVLAHVSDTWRDRWAHTSPGRGEVDFAAYADALRAIGYDGPTIYELVDLEPPLPRLHDDIATLASYGWATDAPARLAKSGRSR